MWSISSKIDCAPQTLNDWINRVEVESCKQAGVSSEMADKTSGPHAPLMQRLYKVPCVLPAITINRHVPRKLGQKLRAADWRVFLNPSDLDIFCCYRG